MATYFGTARTNYFHVKDKLAFDAFIENFYGIDVVTKDGDSTGFIALLFEDGPPSWDPDTEDEIDFMDELAPHLADGSVAIMMEAGAEKLRYVNGYAIAINNKGERKDISLNAIYDLAKELGTEVTLAEY